MMGGQVGSNLWPLPCAEPRAPVTQPSRQWLAQAAGRHWGGRLAIRGLGPGPHLRSGRTALTPDEGGQWAPGVRGKAPAAQVGQW